jgi:UDP-N-acetylglucosamine 4,6-dehydratase/5-epimerase
MLITGGSGFLGRNLAVALSDQFDIVLGGRNNKQNALAAELTGCSVLPMDVVRSESVRDVLSETKPEVIIHAAATKFVDLAERQPMECVDVNVIGSQNVARAAVEHGARAVIGISTDKAAPPVRNTYGLSKALMERMFCSMNDKSPTTFACVRYGNVAWSTGSVLPVWKRMHDQSGVIGSTGPDMRRFFFTVDEAVQLVATAVGELERIQGKVLARYMKAARIRDLLTVWTEERGGSWEQIDGRPGERDDEFLIGEIELPFTTAVMLDGVQHYLISFNERPPAPVSETLSSANTQRLDRKEMLALIDGVRE